MGGRGWSTGVGVRGAHPPPLSSSVGGASAGVGTGAGAGAGACGLGVGGWGLWPCVALTLP